METETDIDTLARMVAEGFATIDQKFTAMDQKMDKRFDSLEGEVRNLNGRVGALEVEVRTTNHQMDILETEVRTTNQRIDLIVIPIIDDNSRRIKDLEIANT